MTRFAQRFVLEREIAAGGMAHVVLARDEFGTWTLVDEGGEWKISDTDGAAVVLGKGYKRCVSRGTHSRRLSRRS